MDELNSNLINFNAVNFLNAITSQLGSHLYNHTGGSSISGLTSIASNANSFKNNNDILLSYYNKTLISYSTSMVSHMGDYAFSEFPNLTEIKCPTCSYIGSNAFYSCSNLVSVYFPDCGFISNTAFSGCSSLLDVSFPSCSYLGYYAFTNCTSIINVNFPTCNCIEDGAFQNCTKLVSASFPLCNEILEGAFEQCTSIKELNFQSCTGIGVQAFKSCNTLSSVNFLNCECIGDEAFTGCSLLTTASFPNCSYIGSAAFDSCYSLTTIHFPNCSYIGSTAFRWCNLLTTASFPNCSQVLTSAFYYCKSLSNISLPNCRYISGMAFGLCSLLTTASFPNCSYIGNYAFADCISLNEVDLSVCEYVDASAFVRCKKITTIKIPNCSYIGYSAFYNCYSLSTIYLNEYSSVATLYHSNAFGACTNLNAIFVPLDLVSSYKTATNWSYYSNYIKPAGEVAIINLVLSGTTSETLNTNQIIATESTCTAYMYGSNENPDAYQASCTGGCSVNFQFYDWMYINISGYELDGSEYTITISPKEPDPYTVTINNANGSISTPAIYNQKLCIDTGCYYQYGAPTYTIDDASKLTDISMSAEMLENYKFSATVLGDCNIDITYIKVNYSLDSSFTTAFPLAQLTHTCLKTTDQNPLNYITNIETIQDPTTRMNVSSELGKTINKYWDYGSEVILEYNNSEASSYTDTVIIQYV